MKRLYFQLSLALLFLSAISSQAQTMTFDSNASEPGFSISGLNWDGGVLFPASPNVNSIITIQKNQSCFNATSFKVACWAGNASVPGGTCANPSNGTWRAWSNLGDETTFVIGSNPNQIVSLGWNDIKWVKIQLLNPGTAGTNQTFDFDDFVYNIPIYTPASTPTITANTNPVCPNSDIALNISGNLNSATKWFIYSTSCGIGEIGSTDGSTFIVSPNTTTTYYIKGIDEKGCTIDGNCGTVEAIVGDNEDPTISCPADINANATSASGAVVTYTAPEGTDNCPNASTALITTSYPSGATFPIGNTIVTYEVTDAENNTADCSFTVTVAGLAPDIDCPANITVNNDAGTCGAVVSFVATDAIGIPASTITYSQDSGTFFPVGTTTVTATAMNAVGSTSCTFTVTVTDTEGPTFDCPTNIVVNLDDAGNGILNINDYNLNETDNCSNNLTVDVSQTAFTCADISSGGSSNPPSVWINEFHYDNGGTDIGEFVEIAGTAGFDLSGYSIVLYNGNGGSSYNTINLSGNIDDEGNGFGAISVSATGIQNGGPDGIALIDNNGDVVEFLSYEGSFTAANGPANGITSTDVGVSENSGTTAGNSIQLKGSGSVAGDFTWTAPSSDSPGDLNDGQTLIGASGGLQVTITVTDEFGNPTSCLADVNLIDAGNPIPDVANLPDITEQCEATLTPPTANDACEGTITATTNDPTNYTTQGTFTVTWTYDDGNNNSVTQTQTVTIEDTQNPEILNCPSEFTIVLDGSGNGASIDLANFTNAGVTYSDNCAIDTVEVSANSFDCSDASSQASGDAVWINEFHYDDSGVDTGEFIEVAGTAGLDLTGYTIVLYNGSNSSVYNTINLSGSIDNENSSGLGALDFQLPSNGLQNGPSEGIALVDNLGTVLEFISYEGTLTAANGPASGMTSIDVGVSESGSAVGESLQLSGTGSSRADFSWSASSSESPGDLNSGQTITAGGLQVTLSVTDVNGNVSTCNVPVTVEDNEAPEILNCPTEFTIVLDGSGNGASIDLANFTNAGVTYSDNCAIDTVEVSANAFDCSDVTDGSSGPSVWINEFHYDNAGTDAGEFVEVAGTAGLDLTGYSIVLYNGSNGTSYGTINLSGSIDDEGNGFGALSFPRSGIQNGGPDGFALIDNGGAVIEFLSYEGAFAATNGPANGATSTNVGVTETSGTAAGDSIQLKGSGSVAGDFSWTAPSTDSPGDLNAGQTISASGPQVTLTVTDVNGNVSTCVVPVKVEDNENPEILNCPTEFTIVLDGSGNGDSIDLADFTNAGVTYSDNCAIDTVEVSANAFDCSDVSSETSGDAVWINEFHYDDSGADTGEFVEVAGTAGLDLTGYTIVLYNGSNSNSYNTINLSGSIDNENSSGLGALDFQLPSNGLQNGPSEGIALVDNSGTVLEFISYEGTLTAANGPASGMTSTDVGVSESGSAVGESLQLSGTGNSRADFAWTGSSAESPGNLNAGQTITTDGLQVTLTVTDVNGNVSTCTVPVTIEDNEIPVINGTPTNITMSNDLGTCNAVVNWTLVTVSDNCAGATISSSHQSGDTFPLGETIVTYTASDANGNDAVSTTFTIIVEDNEIPVITGTPTDITVSNDPGSCDAAVTWTLATVADNCPGATISSDLPSGHTFPLGTTTVNYTAVDAAGNNAAATSFTVTVTDDEIPVINGTPTNITMSNDPGVCSAVFNWTPATVSDNCPGATISSNLPSGHSFPLGETIVTYTASDANGNDAVATTFTVTVEDNENPVAICPADIIVSNDLGDCSAIVNFSIGVSDNCTDSSVVASPESGSVFDVGTTEVTVTATDAAGNTNVCTFNVTVVDDEAPIVDCFNITVTLDDQGMGGIDVAAFIAANNSTDNCEIDTITLSETTFDCSSIGGDLDELIISEYVDGTGNNDWIEIFNGTGNTIVLGDVVNGSLVSYYSINIYPDGSSTPITIGLLGSIGDRESYKISHTDAPNIIGNPTNNFGSPLMVFDGNDAIALANNGVAVDVIGEIGVNPGSGWSSTSNSTNATTLVRSETIQQGNVSSFVANFETEWIQSAQNNVSNLGDHDIEISDQANNVILTVTDIHGNVSTCEGSVTVVDAVLPEALCQDVTVQLDADGNGSTTAQAVDNGSNDACGIGSLALSQTQFTCADIGTVGVTLTVTDSNGNVSTCTATVTVEDNVAPEALCQPAIVQLDANGEVNITVDDIDNSSNDACGIANRTLDITSFTCADVGSPVTVELTVTDNNGNVSTCQTTVTVEDNVPPEALCQPATVILDANGEASITIVDIDNGSNDACGIASKTLDITDFTCADVGSPVTVVLTVTDNNGNVSTCDTVVTVYGDIPTVSINDPEELPEFCQGAVLVLTTTATNAASYLWSPGGETTESIEVGPQGGTFTVTVTSATNCIETDTYTVAPFDASTLLSSYTILAEEEVFLHGSNLVQSGGIGATDANGLIKLHQATTVVEFGRAANIVLNQGSTIVTPILQPANIPFPDFITNPLSNNSSPNVTINNNQSVNLNGSVYGTVTIKQGATVTFSQSDIYIDELKTFDGASIEFSGCANVFINDKFMLAQNGTINGNGNNVVMYVNDDVQIEKGSYVRARIHSNGNELLAKGPNGNGNNSGDLTQMIGLFIAKKVHGNKNVIWNADDLCAPCSVTTPSAPIIGTNNDFGADTFDVVSWPNPSETVFNLKLKTIDLSSESYIKVFDISNKLVFEGTFMPDEVYAFGKQLEGGVYIVRVEQGQKSKTIRLVKY